MGDRRVVLYDIGGRKNAEHFDAIAAGWHAERVPSERAEPVWGALHLVCGLQFGALGILKQVVARNERYVFFDRAYTKDKGWLRVVPDAYQHHWVTQRGPERWDEQGILLQPWRVGGDYVMVVPPGEAVCALFGLDNWLASTVERLRHATPRRIVVSPKGDPEPLEERLGAAWKVVTCTSTVACKAIVAGVPAMVDHRSAAFGVSSWDFIWPKRPERRWWANSLAWGQFTIAEIASGFARQTVSGSPPPQP